MRGWPFLIARGRRRGYAVLLAPAFLGDEYGMLEEVAGPVSAAEPVRVATTRGGNLNVAWTEHKVTADDLADGAAPLDEHSRPLRLIYGFVCPETIVTQPAEADLSRCLLAALDTYRRFLADERRFTVESPAPFELRSATRPVAPPVARSRRGYALPLTIAGVAVAVAVGITIASAANNAPEQDKKEPAVCPTSTTTSRPSPVVEPTEC